MSTPRANFGNQLPKLPEGVVVASYQSYDEARAAVDTLARRDGFSLQQISIVGSDLKSVERVMGRMSAGRAAASGAVTGVMMGLFVSLMWLLIYPQAQFSSIIGVFLLAIAFGVIWSLLAYLVSPRKREFTSMMQLTAAKFDLLVPASLAAEAGQVLGVGRNAGAGRLASAPDAHGQSQAVPGLPSWPDVNRTLQQEPVPGASTQPPSMADQSNASSSSADTDANTPPQRPRTYGEMQDELRRQAAAEAARNAERNEGS
ncbi:general stress protein [Gulosibacter bifidus]|uniref:General stress protein n=1 Tax=Gulosibacter bifidus TaxID=272239 RepID=A0ABW5RHR9_9MICO|nr:general stress protein [Gulosibacter bifidus]